jgi:serine phosphatase RsbU (regulator of sigma subunit)
LRSLFATIGGHALNNRVGSKSICKCSSLQTEGSLQLSVRVSELRVSQWLATRYFLVMQSFWIAGHAAQAPWQTAGFGGDFADVLPVEHGKAYIIGDVAGHGVELSCRALRLRAHVRRSLYLGASPVEALIRANELLSPTDFATLFIGIAGPIHGRFCYASAGHPAPLIFSEMAHDHLEPTGPLLGLEPSEQPSFSLCQVSLAPNAVLVAVTDGIIDACTTGPRSEQFGSSGVASAYRQARKERVDPAEAVYKAAVHHSGGSLRDDGLVLAAPLWLDEAVW